MKTPLRILSFIVVLVGASTCGEGKVDPSLTSTLVDKSGVQVVTVLAGVDDLREIGKLDSLPDFKVGSFDGEQSDAFGSVRAARSLPDGSVLVADGQALQVKLFDPGGRPLATVGRKGGGPGEFSHLTSIAHANADSVWVWDSRAQRLSVFDLGGTFTRSIYLGGRSANRIYRIHRLPDGRLVSFSRWLARPGEAVDRTRLELRRDSILLELRDPIGVVLDTIALVPSLESAQQWDPSGGSTLVTLPFGRRGYYAVTGDMVVGGFNERFEIRWWNLKGNAFRSTQWPAYDRPLTAADISTVRTQWRSQPNLSPNDARVFTRAFEDFPHPENRPTFERVLPGAGSGVWLREHHFWFKGDKARWWFLDGSSGKVVGFLEVPASLTVHEIGPDYVLGSTLTESGVPQVFRYRW